MFILETWAKESRDTHNNLSKIQGSVRQMVLTAESMPLDWLFRAMGKLNCQGVWQLSRELGAAALEGEVCKIV